MNAFEQEIIRHCSPTLAGIKTGNLFSYPYTNNHGIFPYLPVPLKRPVMPPLHFKNVAIAKDKGDCQY